MITGNIIVNIIVVFVTVVFVFIFVGRYRSSSICGGGDNKGGCGRLRRHFGDVSTETLSSVFILKSRLL